MGLFKDLRSTVDNANTLAANAQVMQAQYAAQAQAATAPVASDDPIWSPIEGVTLDQYARLTAQMARLNLPGIEAVEAWVQTQGVAAGTWQAVQTGWTSRMAQSMEVRTRYGNIYAAS